MAQAATNTRKSPKGNRRVRRINAADWKRERNAKLRRNVHYAAAAKATRTALEVTQAQVARRMRRSVQSIYNRESGFYFWAGGAEELTEYQRLCMEIAGV